MENNEENKSNAKSTKKGLNIIKDFTIKKTIPTIKTTDENTKKAVTNVSNKEICCGKRFTCFSAEVYTQRT